MLMRKVHLSDNPLLGGDVKRGDGTLRLLGRHNPQLVHSLVSAQCHASIPCYVHSFVARGSKYVPDLAFFRGRDNAEGEPRPPRLKSSWLPPADEAIIALQGCLQRDLESYAPQDFKPNISYYDKLALNWLRRNSSRILLVDSDKGLGDVWVERPWLRSQCIRLLRESCEEVPHDAATNLMNGYKVQLQMIMDIFSFTVL